jgi:hypothetical protein
MTQTHGRQPLSAEQITRILEAGQIPLDARERVGEALEACIDEVWQWCNLPQLDRKAYRDRLNTGAKALRKAGQQFTTAQPPMRRSINDFVRIHLKSVLPMELIEQLHPGATIPPYQPWDALPDDYPQPSDLGPRWGGFDAVGEYNRFDVTRTVYFSEHGAKVVEALLNYLAESLEQQLLVDKAAAPRGGAPGQPERNRLISHLIGLWERELGWRAKSSPGGQFIAFVAATFVELKWDGDVETRVGRVLRAYRRAAGMREAAPAFLP